MVFSKQKKGRRQPPPKTRRSGPPPPPAGNPNPPEAPYQANFKEGAGATTHFSGCEPYPTPQPAAWPSIEPPRQTSIMAPRSTPAQADWAASVGPNLSDRRLWPSGSRAQPWSLFAFFLSTQKEGPRRRGGRRDDWKIAEKGWGGTRTKKGQKGTRPRPKAPKFKKRPAACLEGKKLQRERKALPRPGIGKSHSGRRGCHFEKTACREKPFQPFKRRFSFPAAAFFKIILLGDFASCGKRPGAVRPGPGPGCPRWQGGAAPRKREGAYAFFSPGAPAPPPL